jgi:hypothetical protein
MSDFITGLLTFIFVLGPLNILVFIIMALVVGYFLRIGRIIGGGR